MHRLWTEPIPDARVRAAWQSQLTAAIKTPGLLRELVRHRGELLPCFAGYYQQLRALPKRVRRALQRRWATSLAGVALMCVLGVGPAQAAIINVTTNVPDAQLDSECSLIEAINNANADGLFHIDCSPGDGADTIVLPANSIHTLTVVNNTGFYGATGLPVISSEITIDGNNSTIQRDTSAPNFRLFMVGSAGKLTLQETTLSGGKTQDFGPPRFALSGGAIATAQGSVSIINSTISGK